MSVRLHLLSGPARIEYEGVVFYTESDARLELRARTSEGGSIEIGPLERWFDDVTLTVAFRPAAAWSAEVLAMLFPYANALPGQSLFAGRDRPLVIHSPDGLKLILQSAALTRMPELFLGGAQPVFGEAEFRALPAQGGPRSVADALYEVGTAPWRAPEFERVRLMAEPMRASWGEARPWNDLQAVNGFALQFPLRLREEISADIGVVDLSVVEIGAQANFLPTGPNTRALLDAVRAQGPGAGRNASLYPDAADLRFDSRAGGPRVRLRRAALLEAPLAWGTSAPHLGRVTLAAQRPLFAGTGAAPLFEVGVAA